MKKYFLIITALFSALLCAGLSVNAFINSSNPMIDDVSTRIPLWKEYYKAENADRPEKQLEILSQIKKEAISKRYSYDFWEAAHTYVDVAVRRNWKLRDSLRSNMKKEVESYDEPIVTYVYSRGYEYENTNSLLDFILSEKRLATSCNKEFYPDLLSSRKFGEYLSEHIGNDRLALLWDRYLDNDKAAYKYLKEEVGSGYPMSAILEYLEIQDLDSKVRTDSLLAFVKKYDGKAVALFAEEDLLGDEFLILSRKNANAQAFRDLYEKCRTFEKKRKAFGRDEAALVSDMRDVERLISTLTGKSLQLEESGDTVFVKLRNLDKAEFKLADKEGKVVLSKDINTHNDKFYVFDTVKVVIPATLMDGEYAYSATSGKLSDKAIFRKFTISIARQNTYEGVGVYVADYKTGKPFESVDLTLYVSDKKVAELKDFKLKSGFTYLPESFVSKIDKNKNCNIQASTKDGRLSKNLYVSGFYGEQKLVYDGPDFFAKTFTDRGAYNPGDTVHFKAVWFQTGEKRKVLPAGEKITVTLYDSESNEVESKDLKTNEFGSVATEFVLPEGLRNGEFSIDTEYEYKDDSYEFSSYFTVDDFILPTFNVEFDKQEKTYFPGDEVVVKGKVESYSGRSLSSAKISYTCESSEGKLVSEGDVRTEEEGRFEIRFNSEKGISYQGITVTVKIVDGTGETKSFNTYVRVTDYLSLDLVVNNNVNAQYRLSPGGYNYKTRYLIDKDSIDLRLLVLQAGADGNEVFPLKVRLTDKKGKTVFSKVVDSGRTVLDLSDVEDGVYTIETSFAKESKFRLQGDVSVELVKMSGKTVDFPMFSYFESKGIVGDEIRAKFATSAGKVWAVAEVFAPNHKLLDYQVFEMNGELGKTSSVKNISFKFKPEYPENVLLCIFYFKDSETVNYSAEYKREKSKYDLPLSFSRFEDKTLPGRNYEISLKTSALAEVLAAIYDKSVDRIQPNGWSGYSGGYSDVSYPSIDAVSGRVGESMGKEVILYGARSMRSFTKSMSYEISDSASPNAMESSALEEVVVANGASSSVLEEVVVTKGASSAAVRENFANTLAFEPFLKPDKDGNVTLKFKTSDKLSTYTVQVFAHDKNVNNAVISREFMVSLPVQLSVVEPKYLYESDKFRFSVQLTNSSDKAVNGKVQLYLYDTKDYKNAVPVSEQSVSVSLQKAEAKSHAFDVEIPKDAEVVGLKAVFVPDEGDFSDAVFVSVPIYKNRQVITESHSAVLLSGKNEQELVEKLRSEFANGSGYGAEYKTISVMDMVKEALPSKFEPYSDNIISLTETFYVRKLARKLGVEVKSEVSDEQILEKIYALRQSDGGFAWFAGMHSSPVLSEIVLERMLKLKDMQLFDFEAEPTVKYLDKVFTGNDIPEYLGGISVMQYLYIRSFYPEIRFTSKFSDTETETKTRKKMDSYLFPKRNIGLTGQILNKARRIRTLYNFIYSDNGKKLAAEFGLKSTSLKRYSKLMEADVTSLLEYAVSHSESTYYYPNAVLPFRGLLESEAYAHSVISDLLSLYASAPGVKSSTKANEVAEGIRLWLMLQKETQKWDETPDFVNAINSVMEASGTTKDVKILVMTKSFEKDFADVKASGNDMRIERKFFVERANTDDKGKRVMAYEPLSEGAVLNVGDRIRAEYRIWNKENRSFVRIIAPREAGLRPVYQLSGMYGYRFTPLYRGVYTISPIGYRNVTATSTDYYFDVYPEENTTVYEDFYVTQHGRFSAPVVEVRSEYAPHYRANGDFTGELNVF